MNLWNRLAAGIGLCLLAFVLCAPGIAAEPESPASSESPGAPDDPVQDEAPPQTTPVSIADAAYTERSDVILSVRETTTETETAAIPYETERIASDELMEGETVTVTPGVDGVRETTYERVVIDGVTVRYTAVSEAVTEPVTERILYGTVPYLETKPTGIFHAPLAGTLRVTSAFGWRWLSGVRDFHYGVDFAAAIGTPVYAADGGTVVFAGTLPGISATYGKLVILAHGDTYRSYYAHLSEFTVQTGDAVYPGQCIGYSGATGNVTGPHLHFEIRKNGILQNPLSYLQ